MVRGDDFVIRFVGCGGQDVAVPFGARTLRDRRVLRREEAAIEGTGPLRVMPCDGGAVGGITTLLTRDTAPVALSAACGDWPAPVFVPETRNLYKRTLRPRPVEGGLCFDVIEEWADKLKRCPDCCCAAFEMRIAREKHVLLHLEIRGDAPAWYGARETAPPLTFGEAFHERGASYFVNGSPCNSIYALTFRVDREKGVKPEVRIHRALRADDVFGVHLDSFTFVCRLFNDLYEERRAGEFRVTLSGLELAGDETCVETADAVIGGVRYAVGGSVAVDVFAEGAEV